MAATGPQRLNRKALGTVWIAMLLGATWCGGEDAAREQLNRLRAESHYDAAIEYLKELRAAPHTPEDFKQVIPYEMGSTLVEAARSDRDPVRRRNRLDKAIVRFREFIEKQPEHALVTTARTRLANAHVELARSSFQQAKSQGLDAPGSQPLLKDSRSRFSEASKLFQTIQKDLRAELEKISGPLDRTDPEQRKLIEKRTRDRSSYLQALLLIPAVAEEQAETYPKDAKEREALLQDAVGRYEDVYRKYRTMLAGLYARMYQGRCYVKLGQHAQALGVFGELLAQPNSPPFQALKQKVAVLAAECWLHDSQTKYQIAIGVLGEMVDNFNADESKTPDALQLRLALARAHQGHAAQVAADAAQDPRVAASRQKAIAHARFVALHSSPLGTAARALLSELDVADPLESAAIGEVKTFAELKLLGKQFLDQWQRNHLDAQKVAARLKRESDAIIKDKMQQQLDQLNESGRNFQEKALAAYQRALELSKDAPVEEVNLVRYFTCYVLYQDGQFPEAAEMGEQLARKYPESSGARQAAKIALASYVKLHTDSESDADRAKARKNIRDLGNYILEHWGDQPVGEDVRQTLKALSGDQLR